MKYLILTLVLTISFVSYSQADGKTNNIIDTLPKGAVADTILPFYPGGELEMRKYLKSIIRYPSSAYLNEIKGVVVVSFGIDEEGKVFDVKVVKSVSKALDKEAVRVIKKMPKWSPGYLKGVPVKCRFNVPITFNLM